VNEQQTEAELLRERAVRLIAEEMRGRDQARYHTLVLLGARVDGMVALASRLLGSDPDEIRAEAEGMVATYAQ
jgi:hypothetical protein